MKLLGWVHRKLMQNSTEPMKNYTIGNHPTCFSIQTLSHEQNYYIDPPKTSSHSNIKYESSPNAFEASKVEQALYQEESFDEPFDFLSIGTFGIKLLNTVPPTPMPPLPVRTLTGQQPIEITENDLTLINHELEKFLEAEETEIWNDSSERSSQVTDKMVAFPLQNYLFAASVELAEAHKEVRKTRASLEELFKKNTIVDDDDPPMKKGEEEEQEGRKGNVAHFMKKVVKKKLSKTLVKMLHKKVYPEEMTKKQFFKVSKGNKNKKHIISSEDDHHIGSNKFDPSASKKNTMKLFRTGICRDDSPVNTGHWIKTDSDYLVLEL